MKRKLRYLLVVAGIAVAAVSSRTLAQGVLSEETPTETPTEEEEKAFGWSGWSCGVCDPNTGRKTCHRQQYFFYFSVDSETREFTCYK
ncbi:hypothetical protein [Hymenobacter edaphi]|uniref:hypothetical protein n=1 Tax=Hymenobacter edaphi TaxID=2211146 RepID=UPI001057755B|nr:hypothetical protein [Hymenobacter edaphi]